MDLNHASVHLALERAQVAPDRMQRMMKLINIAYHEFWQAIEEKENPKGKMFDPLKAKTRAPEAFYWLM